MKLFFVRIILLSLLISSVQLCIAQTKFYATASPLLAKKNEYITYTITIENGEGEAKIEPPSFSNFTIVGGPTQGSVNNTIKNGGMVKSMQSISLTYILQPKAAGTFTIGACAAVVGGVTYKTNQIKIVVSNKELDNSQQNVAPKSPFDDMDIFTAPKSEVEFEDQVLIKGETISDKINKNIHFVLQLSKTTCYVGEPVIATYKLFSRLPTEGMLEKNPSFNGVSVVDMKEGDNGTNYVQEKLDGRLYNMFTIIKVQLYPLQAGKLAIESATLNNKVSLAQYDASKNGTVVSENVSLVSKPIELNVLPLPSKNKPANFTGSVGNFLIDAAVEKNNFSTDEIGKLVVNVSGSGNMQLLTLPTIEWAAAFEVFETKITDNTNKATFPISGSKTFEFPFVIDKAGDYIIPKISFSFFNPATKSYVSLNTEEIKLSVIKGSGKLVKPSKVITNNNSSSNTFSSTKLLGSLALLVLLAISYFYFFAKKKKQPEPSEINQHKVKIENELFIDSNKNYLENTKQYLETNNYNQFYLVLNDELKLFLAQRYNLPKENIKVAIIETVLIECGVNNSLALATEQLMQKVELELYTPYEKDKNMKIVYSDAQALIQKHIL